MSNRLLPLDDPGYWWLRYVLGIAAPIALLGLGLYSIMARHSYAITATRHRRVIIWFVPVQGEQAILMGVAYIGIAVVLFAYCYAQYHEKLGFYYEWILAPGGILACGGILWCSWISLVG
jgi:hypothetical protein